MLSLSALTETELRLCMYFSNFVVLTLHPLSDTSKSDGLTLPEADFFAHVRCDLYRNTFLTKAWTERQL